jgi:hypothetical protein
MGKEEPKWEKVWPTSKTFSPSILFVGNHHAQLAKLLLLLLLMIMIVEVGFILCSHN